MGEVVWRVKRRQVFTYRSQRNQGVVCLCLTGRLVFVHNRRVVEDQGPIGRQRSTHKGEHDVVSSDGSRGSSDRCQLCKVSNGYAHVRSMVIQGHPHVFALLAVVNLQNIHIHFSTLAHTMMCRFRAYMHSDILDANMRESHACLAAPICALHAHNKRGLHLHTDQPLWVVHTESEHFVGAPVTGSLPSSARASRVFVAHDRASLIRLPNRIIAIAQCHGEWCHTKVQHTFDSKNEERRVNECKGAVNQVFTRKHANYFMCQIRLLAFRKTTNPYARIGSERVSCMMLVQCKMMHEYT
jgi:hypothetical protein